MASSAIDGKYKTILTITLMSVLVAIVTYIISFVTSTKKSKQLIHDIVADLSVLEKASEEIANGNFDMYN